MENHVANLFYYIHIFYWHGNSVYLLKNSSGRIEEAEQHAENFKTTLTELKELVPEDAELLNSIEQSFQPYYDIGIKMANTYIKEGTESGNKVMEEFDSVAEKLGTNLQKYITLTAEHMETAIAKIKSSIIRMMIINAIVLFIALLYSGTVLIIINRYVLKPIKLIQHTAKELSKGNLSITNDYQENDEIGELSKEMNHTAVILNKYITNIRSYTEEIEDGNLTTVISDDFSGDFIVLRDSLKNVCDSLNHMMKQIHAASDSVALRAEQVSDGAQVLADGSSEQTKSVEHLEDTITTTADNIMSITDTTKMPPHK